MSNDPRDLFDDGPKRVLLSLVPDRPSASGGGNWPSLFRNGANRFKVILAQGGSSASLLDVTAGGPAVETITLDQTGVGVFTHVPVPGHIYVADVVVRVGGGLVPGASVPPTPPAGDTTAPTITSALSATIPENVPYAITLTANEAGVTFAKRTGSDAAAFVLTGAALSLAARNFEVPGDTGSGSDNTYVCPLRATDAAGNATDFAVTWTISDVFEATRPNPPTITVTSGDGQNTIAWVDGASGGATITSHELHRGTSGGPRTVVATFSTASPYIDTGRTNGVTYQYSLIAVNSLGNSDHSAVLSGTPAPAGVPIATAPPLVAGQGKPGQTLTIQDDATYTSTPSSITKQWVIGEPDGDPATFTEVLSTDPTLTLNDTTHLGKRIARREIPAGGAPVTSCGVVCTDLNFGSYFGYGINDSGQPVGVKYAQAYQELVGGRGVDFIHDGSGANTWSNAVSSSSGTVHGVWKTAFPGSHMVWNTPLCVSETAPFSGAQWRFNDDTGDDVQAKPLIYTANGSADAHFTSIANNLLAANYGTTGVVTIRLGHEAQGGWYPWVAFNANVQASSGTLTIASAVVLNSALSINGTTITFSGGTSLASVITAINAETATHGVTANAPTTIGNSGDRIKLSQNPKTRDMVLANVTGTPLTSLKLTAGTFQASFKNYIAAFRHVVDIFRARALAAGKPDYFKFQWCPNKNELKCAPYLFYPGDAYVDEISVDIYNDRWSEATRYNPVGNFDAQMIGYGKTFVSGKNAYAGLWFKEFAEAQGATPMSGRDANGAAKAHSWNEWGTGFRPSFADPIGSGGDDGYYMWSTLKWQQAGHQKGYSGPWNSYAADYHTRSILSSIVPNSVRNNSPKGFSQWLGGGQTFTVEGELAAYLWDEQPKQLRAFVGWWGTEAAQRALGTDPVIPTPTITCPDIVAAEGRNAAFQLNFSSPLNAVVEVITQTQDGTAIAGSDYTAREPTRSYIMAGATSHIINVPVSSDAATEGLETFKLLLARPTTPSAPPNAYVPNYNLGTVEALCTIYPGLAINDVSVLEEEPSGIATFLVTIAHAVAFPFSVTVTTRDGTAVAGTDYTAHTEVLMFAPGDVSKSVAVSLIDDTITENAKIFYVDLSAPNPGAIFDGIGQCTIAANDEGPETRGSKAVYDASKLAPIAGLASWPSAKTGGETLTQTTAANQPAVVAAKSATGLARAVFTRGASGTQAEIDFIGAPLTTGEASKLFNSDAAGESPDVFFMVAFKTNGSTNSALMRIAGAQNATQRICVERNSSTGRLSLASHTSTDAITMAFTGPTLAANAAHVVGVRIRNNVVDAWCANAGADAVKVIDAAAWNPVNQFTGMQVRFGAALVSDAFNAFAGELGEASFFEPDNVIYLDGVTMSDAEAVTKVNALRTKWGAT